MKGNTPQYGKIQDPKLNKGDFVFVLPQTDNNNRGLETLSELTVTSVPIGATVYVNGTDIGKTPIHSYQIDTGIRREKEVEIGLEQFRIQKSHIKNATLIGGTPIYLECLFREEMLAQPNIQPKVVGKRWC